MLWQAFPARLAFVEFLCLLGGVLPSLFVLLVARLAVQLPDAVAGGWSSAAGRSVQLSLAGVAGLLVAQEVVAAVLTVCRWDLYRRYEEYLVGRVLAATVSAPDLRLFEDPDLAELADRAVRIAQFEPGDLVSGLSTKWAAVAPGVAATVLVATVWPLAAVVLAALWIVAGRQMRSDFRRIDRENWAGAMRRAGYLTQIGQRPEWAKEVRVFGLVGWVSRRFGWEWDVILAEMGRARRVGQRRMVGLLGSALLANAAVLLMAVHSALGGALGIGGFTVLAQGLLAMAALAAQDGDVLIEYGASRPPVVLALERAIAAHTTRPSGGISVGGRPECMISFEGVGFGYPGRSRPVFDNLNLDIAAGRSLAIVGLNGAGKTTLIKLLTGLETPQRGRITIDGTDLADLDPDSWHRAIAAIFQDFVRYELSARDNIALGAVDAAAFNGVDEQVLAAARLAGADDILADLPNGLDTPLSRRFAGGSELSGGQWQRIALARALFAVRAGARVLVLDEPTAQLDVRAEADMYDRFFELTRGLTTIVISHRFSTVRRADRIVVLDGGAVTEDGTHDELLAVCGTYARLFHRQAMRYSPEGVDDA